MNSNTDYSLITPVRPCSSLNTQTLFDDSYVEGDLSPVDQFLKNTKALNILAENMTPGNSLITSLVFLGYMSAVESYVRTLARKLIFIDEHAQHLVEEKSISFGAAWHHKSEYLSEALFENISFSGTKALKAVFIDCLGVDIQTREIKALLDQYANLCQVRHCSIHRFGMLGTNSAIALGLNRHTHLLGKPVLIGKAELEVIGEILLALVKTLNNIAYASVLERTANHTNTKSYGVETTSRYTTIWCWHRSRDKGRFTRYYKLFSSKQDATPSKPLEEMYELFRQKYKPTPSKKVKVSTR